MDFVKIIEKPSKNSSKNRESGVIEVVPEFVVGKTKDLMVRGRSFYAIWDEEAGCWRDDELNVPELIDAEVYKYIDKHPDKTLAYNSMSNFRSMHWTTYCSYIKSIPNNWRQLDSKILFRSDKSKKTDYSTKRLPYDISDSDTPNYNTLMNVLYAPEERQKLEWSVGAILTGDSQHIQKFFVLYGGPGTGKSTFLNILQDLVEGYYVAFSSKDLVGNDSFATEVFKSQPLVAIDHDGDLSRIENNHLLNSIISHEKIVINEKHKSRYEARLTCFLYVGTNKPVKITDNKSGLLRRLIDVNPTGNTVPKNKYNQLMKGVQYELGGIANHCIKVYQELGEDYYRGYRTTTMMYETNGVYNFIDEYRLMFENAPSPDEFKDPPENSYFKLNQLYEMYIDFCKRTGEQYPLKRSLFRSELQTYFDNYAEQKRFGDKRVSWAFWNFKKDIFKPIAEEVEEVGTDEWISLKKQHSLFDDLYANQPAQLANAAGLPSYKWVNCYTKLSDLDTKKVHYMKLPDPSHIVVDFDLKNRDGEKDLKLNLKAANKWPKTYTELSKSGAGIHLHYIYDGDPTQLNNIYSENIEIKVFTGDQSLRRKLSICNDLDIAHISSGLPIKEKKGGISTIDTKTIENEKHLRIMIKKCLNKEFHGATKPEMDFINKLLNDAYASGMVYDVSDMRSTIFSFAACSSHNSEYCISLINKMKFASEPVVRDIMTENDDPLVFFDVEVFKNLFLICYKFQGKDEIVSMVNPTPAMIGGLLKYKLVGYNNLRYDNHILYARYIGYSNEELFNLSQKIISKLGSVRNGFREANGISYTDVYDFLSASNKMSLKKWEIELGILHKELEFDFNEPIPEQYIPNVIEYCSNDVVATEKVFDANQADYIARLILAELAGGTPNQTTNQLTTMLVFGKERNPQLEYTKLEETFPGYEFVQDEFGKFHNMYRGTDLGFGGYVYAEPGMYWDVALIDIQSMHPSSIIAMNYFGRYTKNYQDLLKARVAIKHKDYDSARQMFDGRLNKFLQDESKAGDLANALKTALNSAYGLTSAKFKNAMRDDRNVNNIVALRGALFMRTLQDEVQARGFTVAHIKTDSIKIPNATPEIIEFCQEFAKKYDYIFEHEATYEKMCLVNNAVYIAKYKWAEKKKKIGKWDATGAQFAEPYLFKKLFSKEPIIFDDYKQTKAVQSPAVMLLDFNEQDENQHLYSHVGRVGSFVPVVEGANGGLLVRRNGESQGAVVGTKGYRWKESSIIQDLGLEDQINTSYYDRLVDEAIDSISKYGDPESFIDGYQKINFKYTDELIGFDETVPLVSVAQGLIMKGAKA